MGAVATEFEKIINTARTRKRNEALADKIFSKNRRQSAPSKLKPTPGGSLASRIGVKKPQPQQTPRDARRRASVPAGNVNGEWTHDLHNTVNGSGSGSLRSRITQPGTASLPASKAAKKKAAKLAAAFDKMDTDESVRQQVNVVKPKAGGGAGLTIRGLAGPFAVIGQNFAPGTTAADVESAMTPVGGEMLSCKVVKTQPMLLVEMVFVSREGGEQVISTFNNKTADGRVIKVYPKPGGYQPEKAARNNNNSNANSNSRDLVVDGKMGFSENTTNTGSGSSADANRLRYNDGGNATNKRGRGFQTGRANGR